LGVDWIIFLRPRHWGEPRQSGPIPLPAYGTQNGCVSRRCDWAKDGRMF